MEYPYRQFRNGASHPAVYHWQSQRHIVDTIHGAEANKLKIYEHLKQLLTEIPKHMDETNMDFREDLLPWSEKLPEECHKNT